MVYYETNGAKVVVCFHNVLRRYQNLLRAVILSDLEISEKTLEIAKKINKKETIKNMLSALWCF